MPFDRSARRPGALALPRNRSLMSSLTNRHILLGITGGIAAYKAAELTRRLQDAGARVRVVMTRGAQAFITPLTLQALSGQPVHTDLLDPAAEAAMGHIELAASQKTPPVRPAGGCCRACDREPRRACSPHRS